VLYLSFCSALVTSALCLVSCWLALLLPDVEDEEDAMVVINRFQLLDVKLCLFEVKIVILVRRVGSFVSSLGRHWPAMLPFMDPAWSLANSLQYLSTCSVHE